MAHRELDVGYSMLDVRRKIPVPEGQARLECSDKSTSALSHS